jgi:hypothetical protein
MPTRDKSTTAEQRRARKNKNVKEHRARKRKGFDVYYVAADGETLNFLVRLGYIEDRQTTSKKLVDRGISALVWDLAHGRLNILKPVSSTHIGVG